MPELIFEIHEGIGTIRLNRPDKMNAFTAQMIDDWTAALHECANNEACKVVLITGTGKAFCSGSDTKGIAERNGESALDRKQWLWEHVQKVPLATAALEKPVISAINGAAVGAGMDLALASDLRFAARSARFAETYVRMANVPGAGGAWFLPRMVGLSRALELLWSGEWVDADTAEKMGLVNKVLEDEALMSHAVDVALKLARGPSVAIRLIKRMAVSGLEMSLASHLDMASSHLAVASSTIDHKEAVTAHAHKRAPIFVGR